MTTHSYAPHTIPSIPFDDLKPILLHRKFSVLVIVEDEYGENANIVSNFHPYAIDQALDYILDTLTMPRREITAIFVRVASDPTIAFKVVSHE